MPIATLDEYLEANGLPLDNPAVRTVSRLEWLYGGAAQLGDQGYGLARVPGETAMPTLRGPRRGPHVLHVIGDVDMDGNPQEPDEGLEANLDALKAALRVPANSWTGTYLLRHHHPARAVRSAPGRLTVVDARILGWNLAEVTLDGYVPGGVLRSEVAEEDSSGSVSTTTNLTIANPGTADQDAMTLTLTGTATSVRLESRTWDSSGGTFLQVAVPLSGGTVTIDTAAKTVTQGGADKHGLVTAGMPYLDVWLPLRAAGNNTLRIIPSGGAVTVATSHHPAWA